MSLPPDVIALHDERSYAAAIEELDALAFSESGTPPGNRFEELVQLIEEYDARRHGYLLLPRSHRAAYTRKAALRLTEANPSGELDFPAPAAGAEPGRALRR